MENTISVDISLFQEKCKWLPSIILTASIFSDSVGGQGLLVPIWLTKFYEQSVAYLVKEYCMSIADLKGLSYIV